MFKKFNLFPYLYLTYPALAYFMVVLMSAAVKWIGDEIPVLQTLYLRYIIGVCLLLPALLKESQPFFSVNFKLHFWRGILGLSSIWCAYISLNMLPFVTYVTLSNIYPFVIIMICFLVLKEKIPIARWTAIGFGFCGILFIARPYWDVSLMGIGLILISTLLAALTDIIAKKMTEYDSSVKITLYYFILSAVILTFIMPFIWVMPSSLEICLALLVVGLSGTALQYFLCEAYKRMDASKVALWRYSEFLWALLFGITIWDEVPTLALWSGAALIFASSFIIQHLSDDKIKD